MENFGFTVLQRLFWLRNNGHLHLGFTVVWRPSGPPKNQDAAIIDLLFYGNPLVHLKTWTIMELLFYNDYLGYLETMDAASTVATLWNT